MFVRLMFFTPGWGGERFSHFLSKKRKFVSFFLSFDEKRKVISKNSSCNESLNANMLTYIRCWIEAFHSCSWRCKIYERCAFRVTVSCVHSLHALAACSHCMHGPLAVHLTDTHHISHTFGYMQPMLKPNYSLNFTAELPSGHTL